MPSSPTTAAPPPDPQLLLRALDDGRFADALEGALALTAARPPEEEATVISLTALADRYAHGVPAATLAPALRDILRTLAASSEPADRRFSFLPYLLAVQCLVLLWLGYQYRTGGYNVAQTYGAAACLLVGSGGLLMLGTQLRVALRRAWPLLPYAVLLFYLLRAKPAGELSYATVLVAVLLAELAVAGYLWRIRSTRVDYHPRYPTPAAAR